MTEANSDPETLFSSGKEMTKDFQHMYQASKTIHFTLALLIH
jgi:hypothetical protein